ncbi:MAG: DNA repair protein RecO [candidate division Zixibacteria bacterium]|nr:DNA repair protein RecO [candidate division Zixibacteria bacterium]
MSITKTEVIVLKSMKFGDTSKIATLYTKDYGKIKVIAKGIRKPKSRLAGALQTFSHIQIVFYKKRTSEIYLLSQSDTIKSYQPLHKNLNRYIFASAVLELLDRLITGEESNPQLFGLILATLSFMESCPEESLEKSFCSYALSLAHLLGYKPKFDKCVSCNKHVEGKIVLFSPEKGGIICKRCSRADQAYLRMSKDSAFSALKLQSIKTEHLDTYNIPKEHLKEISSVILSLLDYHTGRGRDLKSLEFLKTDQSFNQG